jgi:hypothetical protein
VLSRRYGGYCSHTATAGSKCSAASRKSISRI